MQNFNCKQLYTLARASKKRKSFAAELTIMSISIISLYSSQSWAEVLNSVYVCVGHGFRENQNCKKWQSCIGHLSNYDLLKCKKKKIPAITNKEMSYRAVWNTVLFTWPFSSHLNTFQLLSKHTVIVKCLYHFHSKIKVCIMTINKICLYSLSSVLCHYCLVAQ